MIGLLRLRLRAPASVQDTTVDWLAEVSLRMLGVADAEAARLAALPLPAPRAQAQPR